MKAFFHDKEDDSNTSNKDTFETLQIRKSKWTPPEGQFSSLDFFLKKCRHDINKLKFNRNTKFSNLSSEEWSALKSLKKRKDIVIKAADKGGAVVVWRADLYQKEALRQLSDTSFYAKVDKDLTLINQNIVKNTINDLIAKQELPATAKNLIITTPRTSCIYFLPKVHKPNNPGRPIVSACSCPIELIHIYSLMLHWYADLMNVTEEVTIHRPMVSTLLSGAFIRGDLNAAIRGPLYDH